jgi:hypothetical protein
VRARRCRCSAQQPLVDFSSIVQPDRSPAWTIQDRKGEYLLRRTACCLATALLPCLFATPAHAQSVAWTYTQISSADGAMPSIAVDRLGYVHVGWTLNMGGSSWWAYHVDNQSGEYHETLVDSKSTSAQPIFPFLSTDSLGFFHLAWRDLQTSETVLYRTNNPLTRALVKKSFRNAHSHDPILDVTSDNVAHIITEADSCSGCSGGSNLYDEGLAAGATSAGPVVALTRDANDATGVQQFSSAVTADGTRHLVFSMRLAPPADNQRLIYYSSRASGSASWSTPVSITGHEDNYQGWPAIVADAAGTLHVVYSSGDYGIYYVNNAGGSWSVPLRINDQNNVEDAIPSIALDPNGRLHVAFQRFTPGPSGTVVSLHYTTNAYDANNWLDPAAEVLADVGSSGFELTHQNRKLAINWVDNQVLIPYLQDHRIWLASTSDVPVTPVDPGGTSTLTMSGGFLPPVQIVRTLSNTAAAATTILKFDITDAGDDGEPTRVSEIHVNTGASQSRPRPSTKDEGLSYLLAGAELVTDTGERLSGIVSDNKIAFRSNNQSLWVPEGGARAFSLRVWAQNQAYVTGKMIELRIKPDQDVVAQSGGSVMQTDQEVVYSDVALLVDALSDCPEGSACSDGNDCTHDDSCDAFQVCSGSVVTCQNTACGSITCNGTASCTAVPLASGTSCDDGNACTYTDVCDGQGTCAGTAISCSDDECNTRSCNGSSSCTATPIPGACGDQDECQLGMDNCSPHATCTNTTGSFTCACNTGFAGDGVTCNDIDECQLPQSVCDTEASCVNTPGSYTCACNSGYVSGSGGSCMLASSGAQPAGEPPASAPTAPGSTSGPASTGSGAPSSGDPSPSGTPASPSSAPDRGAAAAGETPGSSGGCSMATLPGAGGASGGGALSLALCSLGLWSWRRGVRAGPARRAPGSRV